MNDNDIEATKKVKRIAAIIYLLVMAFIMTGTYISQQYKQKSAEILPAEQKNAK